MGAGIAEVCARAGLEVVVTESSDPTLDACHTRSRSLLGRRTGRGFYTGN